jgi:hypothetical protein
LTAQFVLPWWTEAINTKTGLSIGAVTVCCSLCDELPDFGRSENIGSLLSRRPLWIVLMENSVQSWHRRVVMGRAPDSKNDLDYAVGASVAMRPLILCAVSFAATIVA